MCLLGLPEKEKRYQSWPTYWKTNFSLSSEKENLSPQEFALRAEQRLETALWCFRKLEKNWTSQLTMNNYYDCKEWVNPLTIRENLKILLKPLSSWAQRDKILQEKGIELFKSRRHFGEILILILNFLFKNNLKPLISRNDNLVPRLPHLPVERPWLGLVTCLPESGRVQTNNLGEGKGGADKYEICLALQSADRFLTLSKRSVF